MNAKHVLLQAMHGAWKNLFVMKVTRLQREEDAGGARQSSPGSRHGLRGGAIEGSAGGCGPPMRLNRAPGEGNLEL